jgi:hypothetical protein
MTSGQGFTLIKTPFMDLLEPGKPSADYLQSRYGLILEQQFCENKQALIDLLQSRFPKLDINERLIDYIDEPRLLLTGERELIFELVEQSIFSDADGRLIILDPNQYELIEENDGYCLGFQRYYYASFHGEEIKKVSVTGQQLAEWSLKGKCAVDDFVQALRYSNWSYQPIWLAICKAKVESAKYELAIDGSDFYVFYSCIPADSKDEAEIKMNDYFSENFLSTETIYDIKPFKPEEFTNKDEFSIDMLERYNRAHTTQKIHSFSFSPGSMTSFLITPYTTIISKWHCDYAFWSKRTKELELCEFFPSTDLCFERLVELNKLTSADYEEFIQLDDGDGSEPFHYRLLPERNKRFEKIQRSFEVDGDLMIDWEDWHYDFYKKGEDYFLWIYLGGIADRSIEIKLADYQVQRYEREGISYIHELIRKV